MRIVIPIVVAAVVAVLWASGCGGGSSTTDAEGLVPAAHLSDIQAKIFSPGCASFSACHSSAGLAGKCNLSTGRSYAELVGRESPNVPGRILVVPGDPDNSFLIAKLRGELGPDEGDPMPLRNPSLSEAQIQAIADWIRAGAPND